MPPFHIRSTGPRSERPDQLVGSEGGRVDLQRLPRLRGELDRLGGARPDAAALGDQLLVVVRPGGARQVEQALALLPARLGIGVGVEEDLAVVERSEQPDLAREQHAVAEHVARHVADADRAERLRAHVVAELAEVALDRLPGAGGGDPHLLVVVAGRATGGERVAEPVAVLGGHRVGEIGEGGGALVGSHDQVGIVLVVADDVGRRHGLAVDDVVGHVEHRADEGAVAGLDLGPQLLAVPALGRTFDHEAALGSHRHDHARS